MRAIFSNNDVSNVINIVANDIDDINYIHNQFIVKRLKLIIMPKFGITKETRGTSSKPIKADPTKFNGLVLMMLASVTVTDIEAKDANGEWAEFIGKKIPKLNFNFVEVNDEKGVKAGVYVYARTPIAHVPNSDEKDWWFNQTTQMIKHFIDVYTNEEWNDEWDELLSLDLAEGEMKPDDVLAAYRKFFEGVALVFNGDTKKKLPCIFKDAKGKAKVVWGKLLLYIKGKKINNGNFGFPGYPGEGVIELYLPNTKPSLSINVAKGESIIAIVEGNANAGIPGIPTGGANKPASGEQVDGAAIPDWMK